MQKRFAGPISRLHRLGVDPISKLIPSRTVLLTGSSSSYLLRLKALVKVPQTAASTRRDSAIHGLLELLRLFEAEALWESVETIRAVLERLRSWDLAAASRLFWQLDGATAPGAISHVRSGVFIAQHSAAVGSLLRSMAVTSEPPDCLVEN